MLANWSKLSETACWMGIPKSSSIAATSWVSALVQPGVDLVGPGAAGVGDEQVTGDGEERQPVVSRVDVEDHDHVAVDAVHTLRAQAVGRVLHGQGAAGGGPRHQDVLRAGLLAGGERPPLSPRTSTRLRSWVR